jgi:hypothetical protein
MDGRKTSVGSRRSRLLIRKVLGESSDERFSASSTKPKRSGGASLTPRFFLHPAENLRACTTVVSRSDASGLFSPDGSGGLGVKRYRLRLRGSLEDATPSGSGFVNALEDAR